jgi:hypothetical protein
MFRVCTGILIKGSEEISPSSTSAIIAVSVISTSRFSFIINGYLLIPWSRKLIEKLTGSKLFKKFPAYLGNPKVHFLNYCNHQIMISITVIFVHLTPCTPTKSNLYVAKSLATAVIDPDLYKLVPFHVPDHMSLFHCLDRTKDQYMPETNVTVS